MDRGPLDLDPILSPEPAGGSRYRYAPLGPGSSRGLMGKRVPLPTSVAVLALLVDPVGLATDNIELRIQLHVHLGAIGQGDLDLVERLLVAPPGSSDPPA